MLSSSFHDINISLDHYIFGTFHFTIIFYILIKIISLGKNLVIFVKKVKKFGD